MRRCLKKHYMKKWLLYAAALLAFCGCDDKVNPVDQPIEDAIAIAPESETFGCQGGSTEVVVTSSGKWTLAGEFDWVTPSAISGKDGDVVKFTVAANETDQDKTAAFTFTVGKKMAGFTVISKKMGVIVDKISVAPKEQTIPQGGGTAEVIVSSSDAWTLTGEYDWATPSATSGKDGDAVKFTVEANETGQTREAVFTFTVGEQEAEFKIVSEGKAVIAPKLELASQKDVTVGEKGGQVEILLNLNFEYRTLGQTISGNEENWLKYVVTLAGDTDEQAKMYYEVTENPTYENRESVITITGPDDTKVEVNLSQQPKTRLETDEETIVINTEAQTLEIPIHANVAYTVSVEESAAGWITHTGKSGDKEQFTIAAAEVMRRGVITFTSEHKILEVTVIQKVDALINVAAGMSFNRAWPGWTDPAPVTKMTSFTLEALVNPTESRSYSSLSTIMGIEGKFLIRMGDVACDWNQIQVVWDSGKPGSWGNIEGKLTNTDMVLPEINTWYHVAVTFGDGVIRAYIDGKLVGSTSQNVPTSVHFGVEHNEEQAPPGHPIRRCFWVGYSYDSARDFRGMMSELRIWNKALSFDQINEPNHFYRVDPASDGLVTYWKFNDGAGSTVKDHTSYGNDLTAGSELDWQVVSIP